MCNGANLTVAANVLSLEPGALIPDAVGLVALVLCIVAVAHRPRRWLFLGIPLSAVIGFAVLVGAGIVNNYESILIDAPLAWPGAWMYLSGFSIGALICSFLIAHENFRWYQRVSAIASSVLALLMVGLILNQMAGYFPDIPSVVRLATNQSIPGQVTLAQARHLRQTGQVPTRGVIVTLSTGQSISGFDHRAEYAYLPPAWFEENTHRKLPAIMMIGGAFNSPSDWIRLGGADAVSDAYADKHDGVSPILVFPDVLGSFVNDTECVNGPRGNSDTHIVDEVRPFVVNQLHASPDAANWAVVGWSMGGTCAVELTLRSPNLFRTFQAISADRGPNVGDARATLRQLYGGNKALAAQYDPTVIARHHGNYSGVAGRFYVNVMLHRGDDAVTVPITADSPSTSLQITKVSVRDTEQVRAAQMLCALGRAHHMECDVSYEVGGHSWRFARKEFAEHFAWLADRVLSGS